MGYLHIENSYRNFTTTIDLFKECYALEKLHGTSAHISLKDGVVHFFSGGEKHDNFVKLFDKVALETAFKELGRDEVVIFGEAYGGKQQGQSWRYGKSLKFCAFDVKIDNCWLDVPNAEQVVQRFGIEFVHYKRIPATIEALDAERDAPSEQARRNGIEGDQPREGVVLRPLVELRMNGGDRIISKHKRAEERETATPRIIDDPAKLAVLSEAQAIATEWVTQTRLEHVLDKLRADIGGPIDMSWTPEVIKRMVEDVTREAHGEIVDTKAARQAIGGAAAKMFKNSIRQQG